MANKRQLKILTKLFKKTGRTFQVLAREAGLKYVPDHVNEVSDDDAQQIINTHRGWLSRG